MANKDVAATAADEWKDFPVIDEAELTPKELAQERKALLEEHKRLAWLSHTPEELARRIPISVFAIADQASNS